MHRRYEKNHVPIEVLRTFVAISHQGTFTKAGTSLGLTQSAISAQIRRLEQLTGGAVFVKSGAGLNLSDRGRMVARYAQRILEINDQLLALPGAHSTSRLVRIGVPTPFVQSHMMRIFDGCNAAFAGMQVQLRCEPADELMKAIDEGYLDIAMVVCTGGETVDLAAEWQEPNVWVRSPHLVVSPNAPIPIISWPDSAVDRVAIDGLERAGRRYVVSFAAADFHARSVAAKAGLGYLAMPERSIFDGVRAARESFIPPLPSFRAGVRVRRNLELDGLDELVRHIVSAARPEETVIKIGNGRPLPSSISMHDQQ